MPAEVARGPISACALFVTHRNTAESVALRDTEGARTTKTRKLYFTPESEEKKNLQCYTKAKMIEVLATRNNLRVKPDAPDKCQPTWLNKKYMYVCMRVQSFDSCIDCRLNNFLSTRSH